MKRTWAGKQTITPRTVFIATVIIATVIIVTVCKPAAATVGSALAIESDEAAGTEGAPARSPDIEAIERLIRARVREQSITGLSAAVVVDGKVAAAWGFGLADVENDVPATADTSYRFAGISRMITTVALLRLVERGDLDLNAPIRKYVPEFNAREPVRIAHIPPNLAGIRPLNSAEELRNQHRYRRLEDTLASFADDDLLSPPGERFIMTPLGFNLLGLVIERVGAMPYAAFIKQQVFQPADMTTACVDEPERIIPNRARGYIRRKDGSLNNAMFVDTSFLRPAEGLRGSVLDLARFAAAFLDGRLLGAPFRDLMMKEHVTSHGYPTHYGMGCFVRERNGAKIVGHGGWQPQVSTFLVIQPDRRLAVAMIANLEQADCKELGLAVLDMLAAPDRQRREPARRGQEPRGGSAGAGEPPDGREGDRD